jgi:thiosulfate dehydrogenase
MGKFSLGFVAAIAAVCLAVFCYVRFGFIDPRADIAVGTLESKITMPSLDAAVDRRAPEAHNTVQPTDANLTAAINIYQANCASCHGDIRHPHGTLAEALYPRAPQFLEDRPDMPENQNFYIIQHGIRLSGMPAWKSVLNEQQIWQVTTLLSHLDTLPPQISDAWKTIAGGSPDDKSAPAPSKTGATGKESMPMK